MRQFFEFKYFSWFDAEIIFFFVQILKMDDMEVVFEASKYVPRQLLGPPCLVV